MRSQSDAPLATVVVGDPDLAGDAGGVHAFTLELLAGDRGAPPSRLAAPLPGALVDLVDAALRDREVAGAGSFRKGLVGACERVDAVVVGAFRECGQLIEQGFAVPLPDNLDQAVFSGRCHDTGTDLFRAGRADTPHDVAGQDVALIAVDDALAGRTGFLLEQDLDRVAHPRRLSQRRDL